MNGASQAEITKAVNEVKGLVQNNLNTIRQTSQKNQNDLNKLKSAVGNFNQGNYFCNLVPRVIHCAIRNFVWHSTKKYTFRAVSKTSKVLKNNPGNGDGIFNTTYTLSIYKDQTLF